MLTAYGSKKTTKIRAGDQAIFFLNRKTLVFFRKDSQLRWDNGDNQKIVISSGRSIDFSDSVLLIDLICQTHNLTFEMVKDDSKSKNREPKVTFVILPVKQ